MEEPIISCTALELRTLFHQCMPLFIALGDEIRLTIIEALTDEAHRRITGAPLSGGEGLNVRQITERTSLSRPAVSHHLKILKEAGIIASRRQGTCNYYYLTILPTTQKLLELGKKSQAFLSPQPPV